MKSVLIFCAVIAAALACPCTQVCDCPKPPAPEIPTGCPVSCTDIPEVRGAPDCTGSSPNLPACIPKEWKIKTFDSACATIAFQGVWYLQMMSPTYMKGCTPLRVGLWANIYPCSNVRLVFKDTTPECSFDYNTDLYMLDTAFNLATQRIETTQTLFKAALGNKSPYAIFNVGTQKYYSETIVEESPFTDTTIIRHEATSEYSRDYTIGVIGGDDQWQDYMVFAVVNQYSNLFGQSGEHLVFALTRSANPNFSTYQKIYQDLEASSLTSTTLVSMDQSIDLTKVSTVTTQDIEGVVQTTSVSESSSSKTCQTVDGAVVEESSSQMSSSSSTVKQTTVSSSSSSVVFTMDQSYTIPYESGTYDLFGDYKILKGLKPEVISEALTGQYYLNFATPFAVKDVPDARVGLFRTGFPATSIQVIFDSNNKPWDYKSPCMMLDRGYHVVKGEVQQTRNVVYSTYDGSQPFGVFTVYSEGYCGDKTIEEISPTSIDGMICSKPAPLYKQQYVISIAGYEKDNFLILTVANKYKNAFYQDEDYQSQFYVLTPQRLLTQDCITKINNEICRIGYNANYLINVDQTKVIEEQFSFEQSYFEITESSSTVTEESVVEESSSTSISKSVQSSQMSSSTMSSSCGVSEVAESSSSACASAMEVVG